MVAGYQDYRRAQGWPRVIYVEHGAGQTYRGDPDVATMPGYAGGDDLDRVALFVCPSIDVAVRWRRRYPQAGVVVAGCPKMDRWAHAAPPARSAVAVTFHWDCTLCPESRGALPFYDRTLPALVAWCRAHDVDVLGHGHPRLWPRISRRWANLGVELVPDLAQVFERATILVADNTSAMFEFASLDRPVIALNAPWFRRDVDHGLRFWSHVPGVQIDTPADLVPAIEATIADPGLGAGPRRAAVGAVYAHRDGQAARRAAAAIMEAIS